MKRVVALAMFAMLFAVPAYAEALVGDPAASVLTIAGKQVPLPEGNWIIAGRAPGTLTRGTGLGSYGAIWNLVLFRIAPTGTLDAMAEININAMAVDDGWGIAADCQRSDLLLTVVRSRAGWDAACFFVTHSAWSAWKDPQPDMPPAWLQARDVASKRGWLLPSRTVTAGFRVANRRDVIDVRFHFVADAADMASAGWDASPSGREKRPQDRRRLALDRDIAEWSAMMIGCIEAGLKNRLSASRSGTQQHPAREAATSGLSSIVRPVVGRTIRAAVGVSATGRSGRQPRCRCARRGGLLPIAEVPGPVGHLGCGGDIPVDRTVGAGGSDDVGAGRTAHRTQLRRFLSVGPVRRHANAAGHRANHRFRLWWRRALRPASAIAVLRR